jgi:hypothetical protein
VRMSQNVYGEKDAACQQRKHRSLIHVNIIGPKTKRPDQSRGVNFYQASVLNQ